MRGNTRGAAVAALLFILMAFPSAGIAQTRPSVAPPQMPISPLPSAPTMQMPILPAPILVPPQMPPSPSPSAPSMPMPEMSVPPIPVMPPGLEATDTTLNALYQRIVELYEAGTYDEAVPLADELLSSIQMRFGPNSTTAAAAMSVLARLYQAKGNFRDAEKHLNAALAINKQQLQPNHPNIAGDLGAMAQLYQAEGRFDEAEPLYQRALTMSEKVDPADPANVGRALNNLAWLYQEQGRYAEAEPLVERSLPIIEKSLGAKDDHYGRALDTLAKLREGQGRVSEAEQLYRRALAILVASLGPAHDGVATSRENLGGLLKSLNRLDEAEPLLKEALETQQRVYGAENPRLVSSLSQLGDLYRLQGKSVEAESYFLRALAIHKANTREIDVYFATNRAPVEGAKTVAFGSVASPNLTFGRATVVIAKPEASRGRALVSGPIVNAPPEHAPPSVEITEVSRLAIRTVAVGDDWTSPRARKAFQKQVFVFVPGFNVSFENALRRTAQIAYDVDFDGAAFLFSWPSGSGLASYLYSADKPKRLPTS
jgi:tetratricopeptide (TPR) repeat protein